MSKIWVACYDCGEQHQVIEKPSAWREICVSCKQERTKVWAEKSVLGK